MTKILSHYQATPLFEAKKSGKGTIISSPDLGISEEETTLTTGGAIFPDGEIISWETLTEIQHSDTGCFLVEDGTAYKIQRFSEETNRYYSLYPTKSAPTLLISGTLMHRIKGTNPWDDTSEKIAALGRISGNVLDTSTGLGYTAIRAAGKAKQVITTELDPAVISVAELNPWSQPLFTTKNITRYTEDVSLQIMQFDDNFFQCIIHDPPVMSLAGDLYGYNFYTQLYRVIEPGGKLFHYIGDPESQSVQRITNGVIRRLQDAGFRNIKRATRAFGVTGNKP